MHFNALPLPHPANTTNQKINLVKPKIFVMFNSKDSSQNDHGNHHKWIHWYSAVTLLAEYEIYIYMHTNIWNKWCIPWNVQFLWPDLNKTAMIIYRCNVIPDKWNRFTLLIIYPAFKTPKSEFTSQYLEIYIKIGYLFDIDTYRNHDFTQA